MVRSWVATKASVRVEYLGDHWADWLAWHSAAHLVVLRAVHLAWNSVASWDAQLVVKMDARKAGCWAFLKGTCWVAKMVLHSAATWVCQLAA